jgi:hypothetical protein
MFLVCNDLLRYFVLYSLSYTFKVNNWDSLVLNGLGKIFSMYLFFEDKNELFVAIFILIAFFLIL